MLLAHLGSLFLFDSFWDIGPGRLVGGTSPVLDIDVLTSLWNYGYAMLVQYMRHRLRYLCWGCWSWCRLHVGDLEILHHRWERRKVPLIVSERSHQCCHVFLDFSDIPFQEIHAFLLRDRFCSVFWWGAKRELIFVAYWIALRTFQVIEAAIQIQACVGSQRVPAKPWVEEFAVASPFTALGSVFEFISACSRVPVWAMSAVILAFTAAVFIILAYFVLSVLLLLRGGLFGWRGIC